MSYTVYDFPKDLDTFKSYYKEFIVLDDDIVIVPIIDIGIYNHIINPSNEINNMLYVDFAFFVFDKTCLILENGKTIIHNSRYPKMDNYQIYHFGGEDLSFNSDVNSLEVFAKGAYLVLHNSFKLRKESWFLNSHLVKIYIDDNGYSNCNEHRLAQILKLIPDSG